MFFSTLPTQNRNKYGLLIETAKYADKHGFHSIWTPERHFDTFGGLYSNPAITSAAIATITKQIKIRAGSLIAPLHNSIRIAEDWSMIDNLSNGRIGISFASGWNVNDFILSPGNYEKRRNLMFKQIKEIQRLWEGEPINCQNRNEQSTELFVYPSPIQKKLPIWVTSVGNEKTFYDAASIGANILTHLLNQDEEELYMKIQLYRKRLRECNFDPLNHTVTVMLHTFVNPDQNYVISTVRQPLLEYMKQSIRFCSKSMQNLENKSTSIEIDTVNDLVEYKLNKYLERNTLIGSSKKCIDTVKKLAAIGVDEIACLLDFGISSSEILKNLIHLSDLKSNFNKS